MKGVAVTVLALAVVSIGVWAYFSIEHEMRHIRHDMEDCALAFYSVYERWPQSMKDVDSVREVRPWAEGRRHEYSFSPTADGSACIVSARLGFPVETMSVLVQRPSTDEAISVRESITRFSLDFNYDGLTPLDRVKIALRDYARVYYLAVGVWPRDIHVMASVLNEEHRSRWNKILDESGVSVEIVSEPTAASLVALCTTPSGEVVRIEVSEPLWESPTLVYEIHLR